MPNLRKVVRVFSVFFAICILSVLCSSCGFGIKKPSIVFIVDGVVYDTEKATSSEEITLPDAPVKEGYIFHGWYSDKDVWENEITADYTVNNMITSDVNVYAYFTHDHQPEDWYILSGKAATEDAPGEVIFVCAGCGEQRTQTIAQLAHTHVFGDWQTSASHHWKVCEKDEEIDYYGEHTFTETITKEATDDEDGEKELVCSTCGYTKTEKITKLSHTHTFGDWTADETRHWKVCVDDQEIGFADEHSFTETVTKEATEEEEGEREYVCDVCGYTKTETIERLPHVHVFGDWLISETQHWKVCTKDKEVGFSGEHTFDEEIITEATEEADGEKRFTCSVCGYSKTESYQLVLPHTATFIAEGETVATVEFTRLDDSIDEPNIPAKPGYTAAWDEYKIGIVDITINAIYTPIEYTATFRADGNVVGEPIVFTVETKDNVVAPVVPAKTGYTGAWESYTLGAEDITINAVYTPIEYTATFVANNETVSTVRFTVETKALDNVPNVSEKQGYTGEWEAYTLGASDITIDAVYTAINYTATFVADNATVDTVNFTIETVSITEPTVPVQTGYNGAWESYTLGAANITINAVYTAIEYTATFVADDVTVDTVNFTVETQTLSNVPTVPEKEGYTGEWETYTLGAANITINAVYTAIPELEPQPLYTLSGNTLTGVTDTTITEAVIPTGVVAVASNAFANCTLMESVTIPASVTSFGANAFSGCTALTAVYYEGSVEDWCGISFGTASTLNANPLVFAHDLYINNQKITTLTIPETVLTVKYHAFEGCSCTKVVLSEGVETIEKKAFENCADMTQFTFAVTVTSIPENMFAGCGSLSKINYTGFAEEWDEKITAGANWLGDATATIINCAEGGKYQIQ